MKPLLLFDVDGTLAKSGQVIDTDVKKVLTKISQKYNLGVVGGGKLDKILHQLEQLDEFTRCFDHFFTECGCVYHKNIGDLTLKEIYVKNIRHHNMYSYINILIKESLRFLADTDYTLTGNFVDLRNGIVYISLIGLVANEEERKYFIDLNKNNHYITNLITVLKNKAAEMNVLSKLSICRGGEVGIAIYPVEYDKVQVLDSLLDVYDEIHYFGDKCEPDGNDYKLIHHPKVIGHKVTCVEDTLEILLKFIQ